MSLTAKHVEDFFKRIDNLDASQEPKFGKMNACQMVCHCTDFFRMAIGNKKAHEYGTINPTEILELSSSGQTVPAPKGFGQIEGEGTLPTNFENDKTILKEHIREFSNLGKDYQFAEHPYFGNISYDRWVELAIYNLNHHLKQFSV
ncbi:hypothetical protein [Flagellimonas sp.]|uniref:hypothetical protein n=1 Tax=Flagellimonas sp. TaxID=2058762 RepID=UPI003BA91AF7